MSRSSSNRMRLSSFIAGAGAVALVACISPPPPAATPKDERPRARSERDVEDLYRQANRAYGADRYAESRDLARRGLELSKTVRVAPRTLALLHELEGLALWALEEFLDAREPYEAALTIWESTPGAEPEVARLSRRVAATLAFPVIELELAERLLLRSIELVKRFDPKNTSSLLAAYWILLDVLDQECRTAEALPLIEATEALVNAAQPKSQIEAQSLCRVRANFAANAGDLEGAIEWERRGLDELASLDSSTEAADRRDVIYERLAYYETERGNYVAARDLVEKRLENAPGTSLYAKSAFEEERHFAYFAARDPRLPEHDGKYELVSARAGDALFPAELPEKRACLPEPPGRRLGRLARYRALHEIAEPCLKDRSGHSQGQSITVFFRVVAGKVVAVEALGRRADPWVARCVADAVLHFEHPTDKYSEFEDVVLD